MDNWTAFILGLVGSIHCAGMCGPLALALPARQRMGRGFFLAGRAAYNLGRIVTYCLLGVVFGFVGHSLYLAGIQRWTSIALGLLLLAGLFASSRFSLSRPVMALVTALKGPMASLLRQPALPSLALLGLLNGLLPCGLVYVACAGAAATGSVLAAVSYMAAFGLGTVPVLLAIGISGQLIPAAFRTRLRQTVPVAICLLSALLILRGMSLGIPYLSPDLAPAGPGCCHK